MGADGLDLKIAGLFCWAGLAGNGDAISLCASTFQASFLIFLEAEWISLVSK
jgi:hypothetical protein